MIGLFQEQRLEQRMELNDILFPCFDIEVPSSAESLEHLLENFPQKEGEKLRYAVSGGWAVEILSGKKRKHHDIDIIRTSRKPINFMLDEQTSKSYFGILSMSGKKFINDYLISEKWDMNLHYDKDKQFELYMPTPEYLFVSKIAGFLRKPREKDVKDLEALSRRILNEDYTIYAFEDLMHHVPGDKKRWNSELFKDLNEEELNGNYNLLAAKLLQQIVQNFKEGYADIAVKQANDFHKTLKSSYSQGLKDYVSVLNPSERFVNLWEEGEDAFWVSEEELKFRNGELVDKIKFEEYIKEKYDGTIQSFGRARFVNTKQGKMPLFGKKVVEKSYEKIEGDEKHIFAKNWYTTDIYDKEGNFILNVEGTSFDTKGYYELLLRKGKFEDAEKIEDDNYIRMNVYEDLMLNGDLKIARKLVKKYPGVKVKNDYIYRNLLYFGNYKRAGALEKEVEYPESVRENAAKQWLRSAYEKSEENNHGRFYIRGLLDLNELDRVLKLSRLRTELDYETLAVFTDKALEKGIKENTKNSVVVKDKYLYIKKFVSSFTDWKDFSQKYLEELIYNGHVNEPAEFALKYGLKVDEEFQEELKKLNNSRYLNLIDTFTPKEALSAYSRLIIFNGDYEAFGKKYNVTNYDAFIDDPFVFQRDTYLLEDVEVDEKTKQSAKKLIKDRLLGKHPVHHKVKFLMNKFGIEQDHLNNLIETHFDSLIDKEYWGSAVKKFKRITEDFYDAGKLKQRMIQRVPEDKMYKAMSYLNNI